MRKVIVEAEVSLDGIMGGDNADFWKQIFAFHSADVQQYLDELLFTPDALLMGRETYQGFAQVWPTRQGKMAERINAMPKYVASRTLKTPLDWNAVLIEGDVAGAIEKLKQEPGKDLLQYGVGELTHTMLKHGLVDELRILVFPFAFGKGPRWWRRSEVDPVRRSETDPLSGVISTSWRPAWARPVRRVRHSRAHWGSAFSCGSSCPWWQ